MPISARYSSFFDTAEVFSTVDMCWRAANRTDPPAIPIGDSAFCAALATHDGDDLVRFELEARVLAGQTDAEIGAKMNLPEDVMARYVHWFFNVRSRLDNPSWIARNAIRRRPDGTLQNEDIGPWLRWFGFNFGPVTLETLLVAVDREALKQGGIDALLQDGVLLDPEYKLLIAIERMPIPRTPREHKRMLRYQKILSLRGPLVASEILRPLQMLAVPTRSHEAAERLTAAAKSCADRRSNDGPVDETERPIVGQKIAA